MIHAGLCCGSDTNIEETKLRQEPDIILSLVEKCKLKRESIVTINNLFKSLSLFDTHRTEMGIYDLGTIGENRLLGAPIMGKAGLQKTVINIYMLSGKIYNHQVYIYMLRYIWEQKR